jgi:DNA-binding PadR family transcriptional regulator
MLNKTQREVLRQLSLGNRLHKPYGERRYHWQYFDTPEGVPVRVFNALLRAGLIEGRRADPHYWLYTITDAGRAALEAQGE